MKFFLSAIVLFSSMSAFGKSALVALYGRELMSTQSRLASSGYLGRHQSACKKSIPAATADGHFTITVALGYMDVSANPDYYSSAQSAVRIGDVLDQPAKEALAIALTSSCMSRRSEACEFRRQGDRLTKTIRDRFTGKPVKVTVQLVASSVSGNDQANKTTYASRQSKQSAAARARFLNAVQTQDVVMYLGHARSGGGPDFSPPRLLSAAHVDYGYYKSQQEGIRSLVGALQGGRPQILAVLACRSAPLFGGRLSSLMGNGTLITANQLFDYSDILPSALATIEAAVGQSCGQEFAVISGYGASNGMLSVR